MATVGAASKLETPFPRADVCESEQWRAGVHTLCFTASTSSRTSPMSCAPPSLGSNPPLGEMRQVPGLQGGELPTSTPVEVAEIRAVPVLGKSDRRPLRTLVKFPASGRAEEKAEVEGSRRAGFVAALDNGSSASSLAKWRTSRQHHLQKPYVPLRSLRLPYRIADPP
ncbi:hypothetical protein Cni_G01185 [Canna indica]|uniref:Uncharacterized protein n=1 Tax=Canna indica TaxID=4628 RepID=A0AAQ3JM34_9LILI|nr:hypothetical protein Cni_G01185 [Canna indica]